jgi:CheY-like chemotaxis protein
MSSVTISGLPPVEPSRTFVAGQPVLIVDDNPQNLKLARIVLAGAGFEVRTATNAEEVLRLLEDFHPSAILMDIQLPGMDGLQLTRLLKADPKRRDIRILALTAYAMKGDDEKAFDAGCDGYLTKPIDIDHLPVVVADLIAGRPQT